MQFSMMSSENLSFIQNLNTSPPNVLRYAGTDRNKKSHYTQKIIITCIITCDRYLGSSILLYVESPGDRLLLMRMHEYLSSDMEFSVFTIRGPPAIYFSVVNICIGAS